MILDLLPDVGMVVAVILTAGFVAALALAVYEFYGKLHARYLAQMGSQEAALVAAGDGGGGTLSAVRGSLVAFLAAVNERWVPAGRLQRIEASLRKAGKPMELKASEVVALMEIAGAFGLLLGVLFCFWLDVNAVASLAFALLGMSYPLIWLRDKVKARHFAITRALPYNLDLLTLSVEAGLDFAAALGKVVEKGRKGPLSDELGITLKELKLGKTREEALRNLAQRVELSTLTSFVQALIQADKMGTPLGKVLRILSTQMRIERTQRAEKLANEAPVKLLFPLICFIFPTVFIMIFAPIVYQVFFSGTF
ncbi:MAG TPA: type II secretion system F family protein [Myxococcales bacterium]|nr:type II secretion system F family protein [Myxococcales bacterium]